MKKNDIALLIKSAKQGKQMAITELYNKTRDYAYRVARQYVPEADIADAVQEAYISVFRTLATFDDTKDFTPWLHTIVKNKCIDLLKRNNKQAFVSDDVIDNVEDTDPLPITLLENSQKRSDILNIINGLTVGQRTAVVLHYLEGMSIKEIADELGITDGTVKKQLHLAKKAIKEAVLMEENEHDNKLYGIGAVPLLTKLLTSEVEQGAYVMPQALSAEVFSGIMSGIATSGIIAGGSLGGLIGMTLGGKIAVAAITTLAVLSTAGAGYLYIEKENAAEQTIAVMAQMEQLNEKITQQGKEIETLEVEKADLLEKAAVVNAVAPVINEKTDENGFTKQDKEHYDNIVNIGIPPDEAFELVKAASPNGDNMTQPPVTPPVVPSKPAAPQQQQTAAAEQQTADAKARMDKYVASLSESKKSIEGGPHYGTEDFEELRALSRDAFTAWRDELRSGSTTQISTRKYIPYQGDLTHAQLKEWSIDPLLLGWMDVIDPYEFWCSVRYTVGYVGAQYIGYEFKEGDPLRIGIEVDIRCR